MTFPAAILAAALAFQPGPARRDQAVASSFIAALKAGQPPSARALLAPSVVVRRWGGGTGDQFDRLAEELRNCAAPAFTVRAPRSIGNFSDRPLLVASMTCGERRDRVLNLRFTIGRDRRIDSLSFGHDWTVQPGTPPPTGGRSGNPPVTDAERDALIAALDRGNADALRDLVGFHVLRVGALDDFTRTSPEEMIEALRGCTVYSAERAFGSPDSVLRNGLPPPAARRDRGMGGAGLRAQALASPVGRPRRLLSADGRAGAPAHGADRAAAAAAAAPAQSLTLRLSRPPLGARGRGETQ